jgi:class 3 adenylate cyclase
VLRSDGKFVAKFSSRLEKMGVRKQQLDFLEKMFLSFGLRILTIAGDADENSSQSLSEKLKGIDVFSSALTDVDIDSFLLSDGLPIEMAQANNSMIQMIPSFYFLDKKRNKKSFSYTVLTVFDKQRVLIDFMNSEKTGLWINSGKIRANDESSYVFQVDSDPSSVNKGFQAIRSWPESALSNKVLLEAAKKVSQNESYKTWEEVDENGFRTLWSAKTNLGYPIVTLIVKELKELEIQNSRLFLLKLFAVFYAFVVFSIVATILSQSFLKPIQLLKQASEDFQKGLLPDISAIHTNELGNVIVSFNHMIEGFKKRKLLERFLSKETTEMVISSKDSEAENNLKKQHRVILFTHIIQFDEIVDRLSPECLMEILNAFFGSMEPIIKSHHGEIDKYIGDAIMVTFATIPGLKSAEERACQTAISMKKASNDLNHALQKSKLPEINFGIGIANGSVITGKIGSKDFRKDFTVIGDPVNLAARLESKSHSYRDFVCLVSEQIQKSVSNAFLFSKIGEVPIKGKSQLVSIYGLANGKKCHAE